MNKLKLLREKYARSIKEVSKYLNISEEEYLKIENSELRLLDNQLIKLSEYYQVNIDYILGLTDMSKLYPKRKV